MSNDKHLDGLLDLPLPGGCDDCDAVQIVTASDGVYVLQIKHDVTCPALARRERGEW